MTFFPRTPNLAISDREALRAQILQYFHASFDRYESLFSLLRDEQAYRIKPIALRHPLIFYFGHTATFFVNKLLLAGLITRRIDARIERLCAVGVDEMSWDDLDETHYDWPSLASLQQYRQQVRALVDAQIVGMDLRGELNMQHPLWVILMGIEHELIHLETSSVLIRQHALDRVQPQAAWAPCRQRGEPPRNELLPVPAQRLRLGRAENDPYYGWDNEYGVHEVELAAFRASRQLVSQREFLAFVEAGGYLDERWWDEEGQAWRSHGDVRHPTFWRPGEQGWRLRLLAEEIEMPWNWPVEVNCHEARAYVRWLAARTGLSLRLPSEEEWYALLAHSGRGEVAEAPTAAQLHLDHEASPCPVDRFAQGDFFDVVGNVWQWTETAIAPYPGFKVHPLYDDFSTPTFDGRHHLIKGGSWISCGNEARLGSRYAFRRHFFQHAGFRYVEAGPLMQQQLSHYESDALVAQYLEFHYGASYFGVANYAQSLTQRVLAATAGRPRRKALDLGCATGRATLELARHFESVTGIDFSVRFIDLGVQLIRSGHLRYALPEEGELQSYHEIDLAALGLQGLADRVAFYQGDACNLKTIYGDYDLILAANLIDRLYQPALFLREVHSRLRPGGILALSSPYTWLEEHTDRAHWIGGFKRDGENWTTLQGLSELLQPHFRLLAAPEDVPFVIRETARKYQHSVAQLSLWERL